MGYCLYDEKTASVVESRDVIFNKFTKGIEMKQEEKKFIQVEFSMKEVILSMKKTLIKKLLMRQVDPNGRR